MIQFSRILVATVAAAAFLTTGPAFAQNAPPPAPAMTGAPKSKPPSKQGKNKCGQTPKGCHKKQAKGTAPNGAQPAGAPPAGAPPAGGPPHTPSP
jgi:hypothetical protein